jgi:hypothetical protein
MQKSRVLLPARAWRHFDDGVSQPILDAENYAILGTSYRIMSRDEYISNVDGLISNAPETV